MEVEALESIYMDEFSSEYRPMDRHLLSGVDEFGHSLMNVRWL
jgi:hypothetical protein